ncbi:hypothetical protein E2562_021072 [Oryza meyeriana var. granulata]|uniref:Uncharacterized protein n=1 Tax=Oryza meyeriana var. granulata TaxID=110450 RepID=A0A6G1BML7_9ORYZ|nr:hypothetical protein E2562_021072 [Oryza meyeriana var. granulata]
MQAHVIVFPVKRRTWCFAHLRATTAAHEGGDGTLPPLPTPTVKDLWHVITGGGCTASENMETVVRLSLRRHVEVSRRGATFLARVVDGRRGARKLAPPCSVCAAGSNPIGCLDVEPRSGGTALMLSPLPGLVTLPTEDAVLVLCRPSRGDAADDAGEEEGDLGNVRRTKELVDISALALDRWESKLEDIFAEECNNSLSSSREPEIPSTDAPDRLDLLRQLEKSEGNESC